MLTLFRDALIGRKVRRGMKGIVDQERFAGVAPAAIIDVDTELTGRFEIIVRRA